MRGGDVFIVTKLDRLARSVAHLIEIGTRLEAKGAALKVFSRSSNRHHDSFGPTDVQHARLNRSVRA